MTNIFFTSDTHFGHENIIKYVDNRSHYTGVHEMNSDMIDTWNNIVSHDDIVYHLGDFALGDKTDAQDILNRLNGRIKIVYGNHNTCGKFLTGKHIEHLGMYHEFNPKGFHQFRNINLSKVCLFHFPIESWNKAHYGSVHLHGHTHQPEQVTMQNRIHVGWDAWNHPVSFREILQLCTF